MGFLSKQQVDEYLASGTPFSDVCDEAVGSADIGSIEEFLIDAAGRGHGISLGQVWFINTAEYDIDADILVLRPQNMKY